MLKNKKSKVNLKAVNSFLVMKRKMRISGVWAIDRLVSVNISNTKIASSNLFILYLIHWLKGRFVYFDHRYYFTSAFTETDGQQGLHFYSLHFALCTR